MEMKSLLILSSVTRAFHFACIVVALTAIMTSLMTSVECLPVDGSSASSSTPFGSASELQPTVEELLRLYNVSRQEIETSRQQHLATHHPTPMAHINQAGPASRQHAHVQSDVLAPGQLVPASVVQKALRNSAAMQRKQEVFRQVMGFVSQNGRPPQLPFPIGASPSSAPAPPVLPFQPPVLTRPETTASEIYGQHTNVGRVRYIQPSCINPKHADEEVWSSGSSSLSLHLFFNLSSIQSQTRNGHQLYVIGAKLRLLKFAEGEAQPSAADSSDVSPGSSSQEIPIQPLRAVPFFDPLAPSDEEKIRVSVHNYTRALKRNRVHKKKLLDSQMALAKEEGYMELDIKLAARWWLAPGGRNFGLSLEVEDTDGQRKPVTRFFRPRNCSADGLIRTDELTDPTDVVSPVLELIVVEVPEGRNIMELPSVKGRPEELEVVSSDDLDILSEVLDEVPRKHRHHSSRTHSISSNEEQADEAAIVRIHHQSKTGVAFASNIPHNSKHRASSHRATGHHQQQVFRSTVSPIPTLATLEDHDLFKETEEEEAARAEADEIRLMMRPTSIFIQRMLQHQHQQQQHQHSRPNHHSRANKDTRRPIY